MGGDEDLQGWQPDPFGRYEERYFVHGEPTHHVRKGGIDTTDSHGTPSLDVADVSTVENRTQDEPRPHVATDAIEGTYSQAVVASRRRGVLRWGVALVALVVAIALGTLIADRGSKTDYVLQDKTFAAQEKGLLALQRREAVIAAAQAKIATAKAKAAAAQRQLVFLRREAAEVAAMEQQAAHAVQVLQSFGFTPDNLCTRIRGPRSLEQQRKEALSYFNLSC